jgi:putative heme iron utilization protein
MSHSVLALRSLLEAQTVAALGTLHRGEAYVSMVPYALDEEGNFFIHVSALAVHTKDMREHPSVSLMVMAPDADSPLPQSRARATLFCQAHALVRDTADYTQAKTRYLARFPQAAQTFDLADFTIFRLRADAARLVGGFALAASLRGEALRDALSTTLSTK